ncbi:MAG: transcriptional regulator, partial [Actinomycetota bacterium]|nr:transcriptional regulator [Actinomycetota bacterium]
VRVVAHRFGRELGEEVRSGVSGRASRARRLTALTETLDGYGYEPRREGSAIRLGNCPFHALAESHRELVCGMNLALLEGVLEGMQGDELEARPDPMPGRCCVTLAPRPEEA